jgi:hypothetical protein
LRYADEGEDMLNRILTGDESRVHHYQPESKRASVQWKHLSSPSTKELKVTVFWGGQEVLLTHFQKRSENVRRPRRRWVDNAKIDLREI